MQKVPELLVICVLYDFNLLYIKEGLNVWFSLCKECATMIAGFHKNEKEGDLKAVYNKYSSSQFGGVAKLPFVASPLLGN